MKKLEVVIRITKDDGGLHERVVFEWFEKSDSVLSLLARHPGKLFTKEQIFEAVWHKDSDSYLRAMSSTIGRIRQKIEDDKEHPRYIKTISNRGYQFMPKSEDMHSTRNP